MAIGFLTALCGVHLEGIDESLSDSFEVRAGSNGHAELDINGDVHPLTRREYTPWITLDFKPGLAMTVTGIVRFYLIETTPHLKLYMTPINIDPDQPALPISHPFTYAIYLSKTQGRYSTLGLCEDTSALNEEVIDEEAFLKQTYLIHEERERMFFDALDKGETMPLTSYHQAFQTFRVLFAADQSAAQGRSVQL